MIISKCPLRISLAGGSTDLQKFVDEYGRGAVINSPINLYTYIFLGKSTNNCYKITYSRIEEIQDPNKIKNDIAREIRWHY
jgi:D-glycero-alpha-D-manno-heptose-7-phosphate kinase